MHGTGKTVWPDQSSYEGQYQDGRMHGQGQFIYQNRDKYIGAFENDMRNGHGKFFDAKSQKWIEGEWKDDELLNGPKDTGTSPWGNMRKVRNTIKTLPTEQRISQMPPATDKSFDRSRDYQFHQD